MSHSSLARYQPTVSELDTPSTDGGPHVGILEYAGIEYQRVDAIVLSSQLSGEGLPMNVSLT